MGDIDPVAAAAAAGQLQRAVSAVREAVSAMNTVAATARRSPGRDGHYHGGAVASPTATSSAGMRHPNAHPPPLATVASTVSSFE